MFIFLIYLQFGGNVGRSTLMNEMLDTLLKLSPSPGQSFEAPTLRVDGLPGPELTHIADNSVLAVAFFHIGSVWSGMGFLTVWCLDGKSKHLKK